MLQHINQFIALFVDTMKQCGRGKIWLALLVLFLLNWLVLYAHYGFLSPPFFSLVTFWTALINKSNAVLFTHYPTHLALLPYYFGFAKLIPGFLFEGLLLGVAAVHFRNGFLQSRGEERLSFGTAASSWIHLILAWVVFNGITVLISIYLPGWLEFFHQYSPRRLLALDFVIMPFSFAVVLALFFFAIPSIVVYRENVVRALGRSLRIFFQRPITCFCLAVCIMVGPYLLSRIAGRSGSIILKFKPEMVYWLMLAGLVVELLANFFWMGTAVRFLLERDSESATDH